MKKKMKTIFVVLISGLIIIGNILISCYVVNLRSRVIKAERKLKESKVEYPKIYDLLNSITYESFIQMMEEKKSFIVYIGRPTCSDCSNFEPMFIEAVKGFDLSQDILYLNVARIHENAEEWSIFKKRYNIQYTPTIAQIKNGVIENMIGWTPEQGLDMKKINIYLNNLSLLK